MITCVINYYKKNTNKNIFSFDILLSDHKCVNLPTNYKRLDHSVLDERNIDGVSTE